MLNRVKGAEMNLKTLTVEFKTWADGQVSFRCSNANLMSRLSFDPFADVVYQSTLGKDEIIAEIQEQFGDIAPQINGDIYSWSKEI